MLGSFVISFVLQSLLAKVFGASSTLDAFTIGNSLPYLFINWIAYGAVSIILIPVFMEYRLSGDNKVASAANTFMTLLLLISLIVTLICIVGATPIIALMGHGFDVQTRALAVNLARAIMPVFPIGVVCGILSGLLRAYERYNVTPLARCFEVLPVIGALLVLGGVIGIYSIPVGMITGGLLSLAIHFFYTRGIGLRYRFTLRIHQEKVRAMLVTFFLFGVVSTSKYLVFLVDRLVASFLQPGSVALYHFATRFQMLIVMILPVAVSIPFYTKLNKHLHSQEIEEARSTIRHGLQVLAVTIIPLVMLLVLLRIPVIELWLQHGNFSAQDTHTVATVFLFLAPSFLIEAIAPIAFHIFFSFKGTRALKILVLVVLFEVGLNIVLDIVLVKPLGLSGIALATSLIKFPTTLVSWIYIGHRLGGLRLRGLLPVFLKVVIASVFMIPVIHWGDTFLRGSLGFMILDRCIRLGSLSLLGASTYVLLCILFRVREVTEIGKALFLRIRPA